jgi:hypothetical protein
VGDTKREIPAVMEAVSGMVREALIQTIADTDIIREALAVYMGRMDDNIEEIRRAQARNELTLKAASNLIKEFEDQKLRARKAHAALTELEED